MPDVESKKDLAKCAVAAFSVGGGGGLCLKLLPHLVSPAE
jgi:hypothetical protein